MRSGLSPLAWGTSCITSYSRLSVLSGGSGVGGESWFFWQAALFHSTEMADTNKMSTAFKTPDPMRRPFSHVVLKSLGCSVASGSTEIGKCTYLEFLHFISTKCDSLNKHNMFTIIQRLETIKVTIKLVEK